MGVKLSWLAIKEKDHSKIHAILDLCDRASLGLSPADQAKEYEKSDEPLNAFATQQGWYFIQCRYFPAFIENQLDLLSIDTALVRFECNETSMYALAEYWQDGEMVWSVHHEGAKGVFHLVEHGCLPQYFVSIKERCFAEQVCEGGVNAGVDMMIEIPILLAKEMTGFRYDEGFSNGDEIIETSYSVLSRKD